MPPLDGKRWKLGPSRCLTVSRVKALRLSSLNMFKLDSCPGLNLIRPKGYKEGLASEVPKGRFTDDCLGVLGSRLNLDKNMQKPALRS